MLPSEIILLLLNISSIRGKTQFQKQVFLTWKKIFYPKSVDLGYYPHYYGPYSKLVDNVVDVLTQTNMINVKKCKSDNGFDYTILPKGIESVKFLKDKLTNECTS